VRLSIPFISKTAETMGRSGVTFWLRLTASPLYTIAGLAAQDNITGRVVVVDVVVELLLELEEELLLELLEEELLLVKRTIKCVADVLVINAAESLA
jgi:hypothetical protein